MSDQQLTPDHLEILENAAKRVSKHVEEVKGRVSVLATLPGGVITSEMARNIDTVAE